MTEASTSTRCAACKKLRRKCTSDCIFLPYFPPTDPQRFAFVHRIYGTNKVGKMLQEVEEDERGDVAESLYYEARCRVNDPVYGCVGIISLLQQEIARCESQLAQVEAQIHLLKAAAAAQGGSRSGVAPQNPHPPQLS
ncbi:unnamed protein product [Cuscuta epithymum]|uniref:LOB domain-containing protein n=1 Tax=Cuscuta epithymum TaxID=186058 RepID=A0AAV0C3M6_9ASTE|nr:unnamed protein product [Cuscuta epithymum]